MISKLFSKLSSKPTAGASTSSSVDENENSPLCSSDTRDGSLRQGNGQRKGSEGSMDGPQLKEQLASKMKRGQSAIPNSFYDRAIEFKRSGRHPSDMEYVSPRVKGLCQIKQGRFSSWVWVRCKIQQKSKMVIYLAPPKASHRHHSSIDDDDAGNESGSPFKTIQLVGAHVESIKDGAGVAQTPEFVIRFCEKGSSNEQSVFFKCDTLQEKQEWFVGFAEIPGIFRKVEDYYSLGPMWGHGATCEVFECYSRFKGNKIYALKRRIHSTKESTAAMHNELRILQICAKSQHPSIPRLVDFFFDTNGTIEIVTDLMRGGDLYDHIMEGKMGMSEDCARTVFEQIASGLHHLHSLGIGHRDIKPENIMFTDESHKDIKIMDYDLAKVNYCPEWIAGTPCGTSGYMAPEMLAADDHYSLAVDNWSLGVCLYVMLSGCMPFRGVGGHSATYDDIQNALQVSSEAWLMEGIFKDSFWKTISDDAKDLISKLLCLDPKARLTSAMVLGHPFVTDLQSNDTTAIAIPSCNRRSSLEMIDESHSFKEARDSQSALSMAFADLDMDASTTILTDDTSGPF